MTLRLIANHQSRENRAILDSCKNLIAFNSDIHFGIEDVALKSGQDPDFILNLYPSCESIIAEVFHESHMLVSTELRKLLAECDQISHFKDGMSSLMNFFLGETRHDEVMSPIWKYHSVSTELQAVNLKFLKLHTRLVAGRAQELKPDLCRYETALTIMRLKEQVCETATNLQDASPSLARCVAKETQRVSMERLGVLLRNKIAS